MNNGSWYWPDVSNLDGAKAAARGGMWCAVLVASLTTLVVLIVTLLKVSILGVNAGALLDALLFAGIAYGLSRYSRFAAVAGLCLFVLEKIYMLATTGNFFSVGFLGIVIGLGFFNSIRGTFAYRKLNGETPTTGGLAGMFSGKSAPSPGARPLHM